MPFGLSHALPQRIAVIGGGISGMGAAYGLASDANVTLFEAAPRLGGHARTKMAGRRGDQPVDTGFIVFNHANYPHMTKLFTELDVPVTKSNMSFGASIDGGRLEYGLASLSAMFAQRKNAFDLRFLGMVRDILRFNKNALRVAQDRSLTTNQLLELLEVGAWFREYYLLPLCGAIWSTPTQKIMDFPAHAMVQFFENHALLGVTGQHQWYTVEGGSIEYVRRLEAALICMRVDLRLCAPVQSVRRLEGGVAVKAKGGEWEVFDQVVMASHSDDSLALLADPSEEETAALGAITYQPNDIILHADQSVMPKRRVTWSSWNYSQDAGAEGDRIDLTYWMNSLQQIPMDDPHFVTLNTQRPIREDLIYDKVTLRHPVYDQAALDAQDIVRAMNGTNNTWFAGAWMRHGFHEDGLASGLDVVNAIVAPRVRRVVA